jgi:hypothetical protein
MTSANAVFKVLSFAANESGDKSWGLVEESRRASATSLKRRYPATATPSITWSVRGWGSPGGGRSLRPIQRPIVSLGSYAHTDQQHLHVQQLADRWRIIRRQRLLDDQQPAPDWQRSTAATQDGQRRLVGEVVQDILEDASVGAGGQRSRRRPPRRGRPSRSRRIARGRSRPPAAGRQDAIRDDPFVPVRPVQPRWIPAGADVTFIRRTVLEPS